MSLPIERWAREAVARERRLNFYPVADTRVLNDIWELAALQRQTWKERQLRLLEGGEFLAMPEGTYAGLLAYAPAGTVTTTSLNGTVNLYPNLIYSPLATNSFLTPQAYRIAIAAKITTSTSPGNLGWNPLINTSGTWTTGGTAVSGGSTLGATGNVALTASITNAFYYIIGDLTIRSVGAPGANASIVGMFHAVSTQATSGGLAGPAAVGAGFNLQFGGTAVSFDFTTAQSLQFGAVHTVTTITHNLEQVHFMDWN
jgi:hypothetical protein